MYVAVVVVVGCWGDCGGGVGCVGGASDMVVSCWEGGVAGRVVVGSG